MSDSPNGLGPIFVDEDRYPSKFAMEAAVELEVHAALGRVQTQVIGEIIQRAINKALRASGIDPDLAIIIGLTPQGSKSSVRPIFGARRCNTENLARPGKN